MQGQTNTHTQSSNLLLGRKSFFFFCDAPLWFTLLHDLKVNLGDYKCLPLHCTVLALPVHSTYTQHSPASAAPQDELASLDCLLIGHHPCHMTNLGAPSITLLKNEVIQLLEPIARITKPVTTRVRVCVCVCVFVCEYLVRMWKRCFSCQHKGNTHRTVWCVIHWSTDRDTCVCMYVQVPSWLNPIHKIQTVTCFNPPSMVCSVPSPNPECYTVCYGGLSWSGSLPLT